MPARPADAERTQDRTARGSVLGPPDPSVRALDEQDLAQALDAVRSGERAARDLELRGAILVDADLSGLDLSGCDLSRADLSHANLEGTRFFGARLAGATLYEVRADGAEFASADLSDATLSDGSFVRAGFGRADLTGADATSARMAGTSLNGAKLERAVLVAADLTDARLCEADLTGADLSRATLDGADLASVCVQGARFDGASLRAAVLGGVRSFRRASWLGIDLRDIDFSGAYLLREFIQDQNFLDEFRRQSRAHELTYRLWWLTSDCGRSAVRWGLCGLTIALAFAVLYTFVGIDYGDYETALSPVYFSVVTFTTLGYGDALPKTVTAQSIVILEVIAGYVMLGGLLSLITNKLARRAG